MNAFDDHIIEFINRLAGRSHAFDEFVGLLDTPVVKGVFLMALFWWVWFDADGLDDAPRRHGILISTIAAGIVALLVARLLADVLPFRERPLSSLGSEFVRPAAPRGFAFRGWSSFPSDHAVLFFALSTGLWSVRRRIGLLAFAWTTIVICLPRVYLGIHWPTDILAGMVLGVGFGWLATRERVYRTVATPVLAFHDRSPGLFYAAAFVGCYEIVVMGHDVLALIGRVRGHPV